MPARSSRIIFVLQVASWKWGDIGWHTFRHTDRSWLDWVGTTIGVQQKLMPRRHSATAFVPCRSRDLNLIFALQFERAVDRD